MEKNIVAVTKVCGFDCDCTSAQDCKFLSFQSSQKQSEASVLKNIPQKIYLQIGFEPGEEDQEDFNSLCVTWDKERIFDNDIEYVLPSKQLSNEDVELWKQVLKLIGASVPLFENEIKKLNEKFIIHQRL